MDGPDYSHVDSLEKVEELKRRTDMNVILPLIESGSITRCQAAPRYEGASFVPSAIEIRGLEPGDVQATLAIWGEALEG